MAWCGIRNMNTLHAKLSDVLLFVLSLAQQGFAMATVKGYLSALSAFLSLLDKQSLFKSPFVMRFLKGLGLVSS